MRSSHEKARAEGAVLLSAGQCEERYRRGRLRLISLACEGSFDLHSQRGDILARKARILDLREVRSPASAEGTA